MPRIIPVFVKKLTKIESGEAIAVIWAFSYFFCLLCSYYIIRPLRDEMGVIGGVDNLQWLFTATFIAMLALIPLFGWISSRFVRQVFLPYVYYFFIVNLLLFYLFFKADLQNIVAARIFFVWVSVFNLFVVSVFWSFMTDVFSNEQSKRLFAFIAAGGTIGAIAGPGIASLLSTRIGAHNLLLVSALFLIIAVICIKKIIGWYDRIDCNTEFESKNVRQQDFKHDQPLGGSIFNGFKLVIQSPYLMGICLLMLLFTMLATFLYFQQAQIISEYSSDSNERTSIFAFIDLSVNILTLLLQLFLTSRIIKTIGLHWTLAILPLLLSIGFILLSIAPVIGVLIAVQIIRRAGNYAIMRPAREMLYVVLDRESKYKAKNFIDTAVYRGGDAISGWIYTGFKSLGLNISTIALIAAPLSLCWAWVAYKMGKTREKYSFEGLGTKDKGADNA